MTDGDARSDDHSEDVVELVRVQALEADVVVARLRAFGIAAAAGPRSPYESLSFANGVPIFVPREDVPRARQVLAS